MAFAQRRNRLTTHFSEHIPVVKRRISLLLGFFFSTTSKSAETLLLSNGCRRGFPGGKVAGASSSSYVHLVPRLIMSGSVYLQWPTHIYGVYSNEVTLPRLFSKCKVLEYSYVPFSLSGLQVQHGKTRFMQRLSTPVFLNRRAVVRYRALASIMPGHERFSWNL